LHPAIIERSPPSSRDHRVSGLAAGEDFLEEAQRAGGRSARLVKGLDDLFPLAFVQGLDAALVGALGLLLGGFLCRGGNRQDERG